MRSDVAVAAARSKFKGQDNPDRSLATLVAFLLGVALKVCVSQGDNVPWSDVGCAHSEAAVGNKPLENHDSRPFVSVNGRAAVKGRSSTGGVDSYGM